MYVPSLLVTIIFYFLDHKFIIVECVQWLRTLTLNMIRKIPCNQQQNRGKKTTPYFHSGPRWIEPIDGPSYSLSWRCIRAIVIYY